MEDFIGIFVIISVILGIPIYIFIADVIYKYKNYDKLVHSIDVLKKANSDYKITLQKIGTEIQKNNPLKILDNTIELNKFIKKLQDKIYEVAELKNEIKKIKEERCKDKLYSLTEKIIEKEFEDFDNLIVHLECKDRPAFTSAEKVRDAKNVAKEFEKKYKLMQYEYDLLFELFPELDNYIDRIDNNEFKHKTISELKEDFDYSSKYLSKEEYDKLTENERNQLALDRYIESRKKSKWQIGRDYELYIGYLYEKDGYKVKYTGIEQKLEDMGRDLIAENDKEILIIQCKYWSSEKVIHEKHICQLYGTTIHYKKHNDINKKIKPVFITKTSLSETAKDFAKYLKVKVIENKEIEDFPRIKCNINKGNKIYHLPFDQMYDKTIITKENGESFEFTIDDAVKKGFRRAKKYYP